MNFLAHAFLSGTNEEVLVGNFIGDSIKGSQYDENLPPGIALGITLHRSIDNFTDHHPIVKDTCELLKPYFGRYAGVVTDIYFDHWLAVKWDQYHTSMSLKAYAQYVYQLMMHYQPGLPDRVMRFLPYMIEYDWLYSYSQIPGLQNVFEGMDRRTGYLSGMSTAIEVLQNHYQSIEQQFDLFFPTLQAHSENFLNTHK